MSKFQELLKKRDISIATHNGKFSMGDVLAFMGVIAVIAWRAHRVFKVIEE